MAALMPQGKQQYFTAGGIPLVGGKVYTYAAGTTTPLATYTDAAAGTPNTNPVILDSRGEASIFFSAVNYKIVVKDSLDSTIWTQDNLAGDVAGKLRTDLAASTGSANVGHIASGTGAVATTVQAKLRESVSVKDFGAVGDGVTDDTAAIQSAITYLNSLSGGHLYFPSGTYKTTSTIAFKNNITYLGDGVSSIILYTGTDDAVRVSNPINASTAANITVSNMAIKSTNVASTGGTFVDVGSTELHLYDLYIYGGAYGVIFDQTEISSIENCRIEFFTRGGIWLVDGSDHTAGAAVGYTNMINIVGNQFNANRTGVITAIIDDGGDAHSIHSCNFNDCASHIYIGASRNLRISCCEFENALGSIITMKGVTFNSSQAVGASNIVSLYDNFFSPVAGQVSVAITTGNCLNVIGNRFISSTATITGTAFIGNIFSANNLDSATGIIYDGLSPHHFQKEAANGALKIKDNFEVTGSIASTSTITSADALIGSNLPLKLTITGTTATSTGLSINPESPGAKAFIVIYSNQNGSGNNTASSIYMIRCGYNGNNFTATKVSGDDGGAGAGASTVNFTQTSGILFAANNVSGNGVLQFLSN